LVLAQTVRKGKRGKLRLTTDPPGSAIDLQDVAMAVVSSDPSTVEAVRDTTDATLINWRTLTAGTAGPVRVTARVDKDQDFGEVELLDGSYDFDVVDGVVEPLSVALGLEGPIEDDPAA
jgi:hypothetical protein